MGSVRFFKHGQALLLLATHFFNQFGANTSKRVSTLLRTCRDRKSEGRATMNIERVYIGAGSRKQEHDVCMIVAGSPVQYSPAAVIAKIHVSSVLQQHLDHLYAQKEEEEEEED